MSHSEILENVTRALQAAEEIHGPEGNDYIALMDAVVALATSRRNAYNESAAAHVS